MTALTCLPFEAAHVAQLTLQPRQAREVAFLEADMLKLLEGPLAYTAALEGHPVACCGIQMREFGIGTLWSFLGDDAGPYMTTLTRAGRRLMAIADLRRIEATTPVDFLAGCRWLKVLGFQLEGTMRRFAPDGADHLLYSRVR